MKKIVGLCLLLFMTLFVMAEEDFDSFDDEEISFVIKTTKPKILVQKDSKVEEGAVAFKQASRGENKAVKMQVRNFLLFSKLKDIDARYLVLDLSLDNKLKSQKVIVSEGSSHPATWLTKSSDDYTYKEEIPAYSIPDMMQHLYLRVNNGEEKALDIMSILLDKPLIDFDTNTVTVEPKITKEGRVAFRLPKDQKIKQLSLHYYDSRYGNIDIPIVGEMKAKRVDVATLPQKPWKKMSDNFSLRVTGYDVSNTIAGHQAKAEGAFEIVEIDMESKVFALLKLNPSKRFYLKVGDTHTVKLHPITQALPMGLYGDVALAPGSNNKLRLVFYVPKGLEHLSRKLMVELKGEDLILNVKEGEDGISKEVLAKSSSVEGTSVEINGLYSYKEKIVVDMTFSDADDSYSTRLHKDFYLHDKEGIPNLNSRKARNLTRDDLAKTGSLGSFANATYKGLYPWYPQLDASEYIFAFKDNDVILNHTKKRVFVWFDNQFDEKHTQPWYLVSTLFRDLSLKIDKKPEPLPETLKYALAKTYPYDYKPDSIERKVLAKVEKFREMKAKEHRKKVTQQKIARLDNPNKNQEFTTIPPLSAGVIGQEEIAKIKTVKEMISRLQDIQWVPSAYAATTALYAPSSMFTQGWGSENDMFKAVYDMVKDKNVTFGSYTLSDAGTLKLLKLAKAIPLQKKVPFIEWEEKGVKHSLVFPFLKPIDEVENYIGDKKYLTKITHMQAHIKMTLTYMPKNDGTTTSSFGMFGSALGGGTTTEKRDVLFDKSWNIDEVSDTPVDIYFPQTTAFYTDVNGTHQDKEHALHDKKVEPKVLTVEITMPDGKLDTYEHYFQKKQKLQDVFFTFALGMPDIKESTLSEMEKIRQKYFKKVKKIDPLSKVQWVNRSEIYKFMALQTKNENFLATSLQLQVKHNKTPRAIMTMIERTADKKVVRHFDLRNVFADAYGKKEYVNSFNIMSGIFNAKAEAGAIGGKGIFEVWDSNKESNLTLIDPSNKNEIIQIMQKKKIHPKIIERLKKSDRLWLYPMDAKQHIGWLEINPKNYRTLSVHENGMYAAAAEESEIDMAIDSVSNYFIGLLAGVGTSEWIVVMHMHIENYCDLLKASEAMANKIACGVAIGGGIASPSVAGSISTTLGCYGHSKSSKAVSIFGGLAGNEAKTKIGKVSNGIAGFGNGFGDGVALYFQMAKLNEGCK